MLLNITRANVFVLKFERNAAQPPDWEVKTWAWKSHARVRNSAIRKGNYLIIQKFWHYKKFEEANDKECSKPVDNFPKK